MAGTARIGHAYYSVETRLTYRDHNVVGVTSKVWYKGLKVLLILYKIIIHINTLQTTASNNIIKASSIPISISTTTTHTTQPQQP